MKEATLRQKLGVMIYDIVPFLWNLRTARTNNPKDYPWVSICNRKESLISNPLGNGARCDWQWTSRLHIAAVYPFLGKLLMEKALSCWPIYTGERKDLDASIPSDRPLISYVIGHKGIERLPHLLATINTIASQKNVQIECIVVEQSAVSEIADQLPEWVRYIHITPPTVDMPYCRSWAFNVGAKAASGDYFIFHDNDMLIPESYSVEMLKTLQQGYEFVNLKRFVFYLNEKHTASVFAGLSTYADDAPEYIVQNLEGGGSLGVERKAFFEIGGFDESFVGWGGEDNEFWERAATRNIFSYGYLPIVHLWHASQPGKQNRDQSEAMLRYKRLVSVPPDLRVKVLRKKEIGRLSSPLISGS